MIGGGAGAFIGGVHRMAAALDGRWVLTAGALSSSPQKSLDSAAGLGLNRARSYPTWQEMLARESALPAGDRVDAVTIVTPNATHHAIALAFINAGFHVIIDKPMVTTAAHAAELVEAVRARGVVGAVTYNYTGYPMVRQAASIVRSGQIGTIRKVFAEYHQGWLATNLEATGQKQAAWRLDPSQAGGGGSIGDVGTHAENLISTVTGLQIDSLCADLTSFVPGRTLDDDAAILLRFRGGARGVLTVSQVCIGERNNLTLRVHGDKGSLFWAQETPNELELRLDDGSTRIQSRAECGMDAAAAWASRLPPGHPEGFIEAFANIYRAVADRILALRAGSHSGPDFPTVVEGARGVHFIERVLHSSRQGSTWVAW